MSKEEKLTYTQLEYRLAEAERERDKARQAAKDANRDKREMHLILTGMVVENCRLHVTLSPHICTTENMEAVQLLLKNYAQATAHEIEQKLGGPLVELTRAIEHIHYLESHARNRGLSFNEWTFSDLDKRSMYQ